MRGVVLSAVVLTSGLGLFSNPAWSGEPSFVEACIKQPDFNKVTINCTATSRDGKSALTLRIHRGQLLTVIAKGKYGSIQDTMFLYRVQHLAPRVTDLGVVNESVRFVAADTAHRATLTLPCGQNAYGYVGLGSVLSSEWPREYVAACQVN